MEHIERPDPNEWAHTLTKNPKTGKVWTWHDIIHEDIWKLVSVFLENSLKKKQDE